MMVPEAPGDIVNQLESQKIVGVENLLVHT
jgi:hypothetical protein